MAKAVFHKNQRVYVSSVGTWAMVEQVVPQWAKGVEEPIKITYDCGLGRNFDAHELTAEIAPVASDVIDDTEQWRLVRGENKWHSREECARHPYPGTHPIVVTGNRDWGGWRVPGSEYDRDPERIETQARVIANSMNCVHLLKKLVGVATETPESVPDQLMDVAQKARDVIKAIEN